MREAAAFVESLTQPNDVVAVTDFGVMPFFIDRRTVKTLNDKSNACTLSLLTKHNASFLIVVNELDRGASKQSEALVRARPDIFQQWHAYPTENGVFSSFVYKIDQHRLAVLAASENFSSYCGVKGTVSAFCTPGLENQAEPTRKNP